MLLAEIKYTQNENEKSSKYLLKIHNLVLLHKILFQSWTCTCTCNVNIKKNIKIIIFHVFFFMFITDPLYFFFHLPFIYLALCTLYHDVLTCIHYLCMYINKNFMQMYVGRFAPPPPTSHVLRLMKNLTNKPGGHIWNQIKLSFP